VSITDAGLVIRMHAASKNSHALSSELNRRPAPLRQASENYSCRLRVY